MGLMYCQFSPNIESKNKIKKLQECPHQGKVYLENEAVLKVIGEV